MLPSTFKSSQKELHSTKILDLIKPTVAEIKALMQLNSILAGKDFISFSNLFKNISPERVIQAYCPPKSTRLGLRYEQLIKAVICASDQFELIEHNLQIIKHGQTLGELDFIIKDTTSLEIIHLEVAIKFYLGVNHNEKLCENFNEKINEQKFEFIGPNKNDSLTKKKQHLIHKQLMPDTDLLGIRIDRHIALVQGVLFSPYHSTFALTDPSINAACLQGVYLPLEQAEHLPESLYWLERQQWILGKSDQLQSKKRIISALLAWFKHNKQAVQLADEQGKRYFVVPNNWSDPF